MTFGGVISGTGSCAAGSDTLTLTGNNTYSGKRRSVRERCRYGNGGTSGSVSGNVTDNGIVAFDRSDSVTFAGVINGTGNLVQLGSGTGNRNNSYSAHDDQRGDPADRRRRPASSERHRNGALSTGGTVTSEASLAERANWFNSGQGTSS